MKKQRKRYTPEKEPISKLRDNLGLQPTAFYRWQKEFFENARRRDWVRLVGLT